MAKVLSEAVEVCPWCMGENVYPGYNIRKNGYVVKCQHCGKEIFLCDECLHAKDNPHGMCDWKESIISYITSASCYESTEGICFRGITKNSK